MSPVHQKIGSAERSGGAGASVSASVGTMKSFTKRMQGSYCDQYFCATPSSVSPAPRSSEQISRSPKVCDALKK